MLNIYDLHKKRFQRDAQRQHYYKKILHKCYQRIVNVSNNCETKCVFKIPEFLIGMPIYNNIECAKYLISCLKEMVFTYDIHILIYYLSLGIRFLNLIILDIKNHLNPMKRNL